MRRSSTPRSHRRSALLAALPGGMSSCCRPCCSTCLHGLPVLPVDLSQLHELERATSVKEWIGLANRELLIRDLCWLSLQQPDLGHRRHGGADRHRHAAGVLLWRRPKGSRSSAPSTSCRRCSRPWSSASSGTGSTTPSSAFSTRLDAVGLEDISRGWLGDPDVALYAVLIAAIWATIGFVFVIFLAGLQNVSKDFLEAATIDGANAWRFWNVTVPQMASVINVVVASCSSAASTSSTSSSS